MYYVHQKVSGNGKAWCTLYTFPLCKFKRKFDRFSFEVVRGIRQSHFIPAGIGTCVQLHSIYTDLIYNPFSSLCLLRPPPAVPVPTYLRVSNKILFSPFAFLVVFELFDATRNYTK